MTKMVVSVIIPVYNAEKWLNECLQSVWDQQFCGKLEISVFDDSSTDSSGNILQAWKEKFEVAGIPFLLLTSEISGIQRGVGYAKNRAIENSAGEYLCFLDADDVMYPLRIQKQYEACLMRENSIIGSKFRRIPEDSTVRYTEWANTISESELHTQIYTAFGPTVVMPTWFCHRSVYIEIGGFSEQGKGTPEDLLFFYAHLKLKKPLYRVDEVLLLYRYHPAATTFSVLEDTIWDIRLKEFENNVLVNWDHFTIWNAGKQGRKFYRSLNKSNKLKVVAFCDVDVKKLERGVYIYEESQEIPKPRVPIIHFSAAKPPFVLCVKLNMTKGNFEKNLSSLHLKDGVEYFHFS